MPRLIDADKLRKDILDLPNCYNGFSDTYDKACIIDMIDEQPTVNVCPYWDNESDYCALNKPSDAEPVRHGRWEFTDDAMFGNPFGSYKCSECGNTEPHKAKYCSNCGCKMGVDINGTD